MCLGFIDKRVSILIHSLAMEKEVIRTAEARAAIAEMTDEEKDEFLRLSLILHETGRLEYPYGEYVTFGRTADLLA